MNSTGIYKMILTFLDNTYLYNRQLQQNIKEKEKDL